MLYSMIQMICVHGCAREDDWLQPQSSEFSETTGLETLLSSEISLLSTQAHVFAAVEPEPSCHGKDVKAKDSPLAKVPPFVTNVKPKSRLRDQGGAAFTPAFSTEKSQELVLVQAKREPQTCQRGIGKEEAKVTPRDAPKYRRSLSGGFRKQG